MSWETTLHTRGITRIAQELREKGYEIKLEPSRSDIPFELPLYQPDILATKTGDNLIVEVKTVHSRVSIERFQEIARIVRSHPGWRFIVSTVSEATDGESAPNLEVNLPTVPQIAKALESVERAIEADVGELAIPMLWNIYTSALRVIAAQRSLTVDSTSDSRLLNQLYSFGVLSPSELEQSKRFSHLRNTTVHALNTNVSRAEVVGMKQFVTAWLRSHLL